MAQTFGDCVDRKPVLAKLEPEEVDAVFIEVPDGQ
jgi:hypothetical protein